MRKLRIEKKRKLNLAKQGPKVRRLTLKKRARKIKRKVVVEYRPLAIAIDRVADRHGIDPSGVHRYSYDLEREGFDIEAVDDSVLRAARRIHESAMQAIHKRVRKLNKKWEAMQ